MKEKIILMVVAIFGVIIIFSSAVFAANIAISDTVIGTKQNVALNVYPYNIDYEFAYYSANMVTNPSFESDWFGSKTSGTITTSGDWVVRGKWSDPIPAGNVTATVDYNEKVSGASSQKISINPSLSMDIELVDYHKPVAIPGHTYRARAQVKGNPGGAVKIVLGSGAISNTFTIDSNWQIITFDYTPASNVMLSSVSLRISAKGDIWVDDFIFWDVTDTDSGGHSVSLVERTKEAKPSMLRWGSLFINDLQLQRVTFRPWDISYGPPPDFDIASFLLFTKKVGAIPFITVPPAFTDDNFRTNVLPELIKARNPYNCTVLPSLVDQLENSYQEHLDFLDYLVARPGTTYGNLAISQGFSDWSQQFSNIYFELGNELWNSMSGPYYMWDCVKMQDNYGNYSLKRMRAMKAHSAWKSNYKVGFNNQWGWWGDGNKPSQWSWGPVVAGFTKDYVDFYSDAPYWPNWYLPSGWCTPTSLPSNETIYSAIFASNERFAQDIPYQYNLVKTAAVKDVEHIWYEINTEMVCGSYYDYVTKKGNPLFFQQHSIGSAVANLDNYARFPLLGITYANHFIQLSRDTYGAHLGYPDYGRRPEWFAFQMLGKTGSQMLQTAVTGSPTWNDSTSGLTNLPYVHAYGYKEGNRYDILVINRDRSNSQAVTINLPSNSYNNNAILYMLTSGNINDNNDDPDVNVYKIYENVILRNQTISNFANGYSLTVPPFSAYLLQVDLAVGDTTPPIINSIVSLPTNQSATITWQTDEASTSIIYYGTSISLGQQKSDNNLVISHNIQLTSLSSSTIYYYKVSSCDSSNNCANSSIYNFTTQSTTQPCTLTSASITTNCAAGNSTDCEQGETISMSGSYTGNCSAANFFQIDANTTGCNIEYSGGDMQGISDSTITLSNGIVSGSWTIPSIPTQCKGKIVQAWAAGLWNGVPGTGTIVNNTFGSFGSFRFYSPTTCVENWQCTSWSTCINKTQTRTCTDLNSCGTTNNKPTETRRCGNFTKIKIKGNLKFSSGEACSSCDIAITFIDSTSSAITNSSGYFELTLQPSIPFAAMSYIINGTVKHQLTEIRFRRSISII